MGVYGLALPWVYLLAGVCIVLFASTLLQKLGGILMIVAAFGVWMLRLAGSEASEPPDSDQTTGRHEVQAFDITLPSRFADAPALMGSGRLVWKRSFETGDPAIDNQHRQLFKQCNELIDLIAAGSPSDELELQFMDLIRQIEQHFEYEEAALADDYDPSYEAHSKHHQNLLARANELLTKLRDKTLDRQALVRFLSDDLVVKHVMEVDLARAKHKPT